MKRQSNVINDLTHLLGWTARTSRSGEYAEPKNLWEEFLYAMSYSRGSLALNPVTKEITPLTTAYEGLITQTTTISIPEAPFVVTHTSRANTRSAITKITALTPELAQ